MSQTTTLVCKLRRADGTHVDLYGKKYHFKPESTAPDAPHVCAIAQEDAAAIYRLLSISEAYALADPDAALPPRPQPDKGQTVHQASAPGAAPAPVEAKPVIITDGDGNEINLSALERPDLVELAKKEFGLTCHHKWAPVTIIGKILEATRGSD